MTDNERPPEDREASSRGGDSVAKTGIRDEVVFLEVPGIGTTMAVLPVVPENAPYRVREGIARRRVATLTGTCPCGATVDYGAAVRDRTTAVLVEHERLCPADTDRLAKAIRRWSR